MPGSSGSSEHSDPAALSPRPLGPDVVEPSSEAGPRRIDFHSHSYLTDGTTSATDMWYEAEMLHHRALALTDHVGLEDPKPLLDQLRREASGWEGSAFVPIVGVELTKVPARKIAETARAGRRAGAEIVIVHGETTVENVPAGTNHAAIDSGEVDVLAHPGLLDPRDADLAREHSVVLEISARVGHSLTNGHVARVALEAGADLVVDSDAHGPEQLVPLEHARRVARGAGLPDERVERALFTTPAELVRRLRGR
jgi:putative hydrolase